MTLGPSELLKGQVPYEHVELSHNIYEGSFSFNLFGEKI